MFKPEIEGVVIYLINHENGAKSKEVLIEDVIYNQHDIEFVFDDDTTLPYSDFLWCCDEFDTVVKVKSVKYGVTEQC